MWMMKKKTLSTTFYKKSSSMNLIAKTSEMTEPWKFQVSRANRYTWWIGESLTILVCEEKKHKIFHEFYKIKIKIGCV